MENFLFHCLFLAFIVPVILAGQKLLRRCLTAQYRHMTWYLYCFCALLFFLPVRLPGSADLCSFIISFMTNASRQAVQISPASAASGSAVQISDYAVSAGASVPGPVFTALFWIWAAGAAAMTAVFLYHCVRLNRLDRSMAFVKNMDTERLFLQCKEELESAETSALCSPRPQILPWHSGSSSLSSYFRKSFSRSFLNQNFPMYFITS